MESTACILSMSSRCDLKRRERPIKVPQNIFRYEISMKDLSWVFFQYMQPGPKYVRF